MRSNLELQKVLLDNIDDYFETGLCVYISISYSMNLISLQEFRYLKLFISKRSNGLNSIYWIGKKGDIKPRIEWIKENIK